MTIKPRWWNRRGATVEKILDSAVGLRSAGVWPESAQAQKEMIIVLMPQFKQIVSLGRDKNLRLHPEAWELLK